MAESPCLEVLKVCGTWGHGFVVDLDDLRGFFQPKQFYGDHGLALEGCAASQEGEEPQTVLGLLWLPQVCSQLPFHPHPGDNQRCPAVFQLCWSHSPPRSSLVFPPVLLILPPLDEEPPSCGSACPKSSRDPMSAAPDASGLRFLLCLGEFFLCDEDKIVRFQLRTSRTISPNLRP